MSSMASQGPKQSDVVQAAPMAPTEPSAVDRVRAKIAVQTVNALLAADRKDVVIQVLQAAAHDDVCGLVELSTLVRSTAAALHQHPAWQTLREVFRTACRSAGLVADRELRGLDDETLRRKYANTRFDVSQVTPNVDLSILGDSHDLHKKLSS